MAAAEPIIAAKDHQGLFPDSQFIKLLQNSSNIIVHGCSSGIISDLIRPQVL